jgi:hypothetical protein
MAFSNRFAVPQATPSGLGRPRRDSGAFHDCLDEVNDHGAATQRHTAQGNAPQFAYSLGRAAPENPRPTQQTNRDHIFTLGTSTNSSVAANPSVYRAPSPQRQPPAGSDATTEAFIRTHLSKVRDYYDQRLRDMERALVASQQQVEELQAQLRASTSAATPRQPLQQPPKSVRAIDESHLSTNGLASQGGYSLIASVRSELGLEANHSAGRSPSRGSPQSGPGSGGNGYGAPHPAEGHYSRQHAYH